MSLLDYWDTPRLSVKRRKTTSDPTSQSGQSTLDDKTYADDGSSSDSSSTVVKGEDANTLPRVETPLANPFDRTFAKNAKNENDDDDNDVGIPMSQTELESCLPNIQTDEQAIEEYESSQKQELDEREREGELSLHERLQNRTWRKGKSSIYVDAFNLALDTVLAEEAHLFNDAEKEVFRHWRELCYESQYLYVRLFLRKTAAWHRVSRLGYYSDIADLPQVVADLQSPRNLANSDIFENDDETPSSQDLGLHDGFRFADMTDEISTIEEASSVLLLDELKLLAKEAKVQGKSKQELVTALQRSSQKQTGLGWNGQAIGRGTAPINREEHFIKKILDYTGDCIRLSSGPRALFERVHLVFYRSTEWTEKSLTAIILAKISRRNFPEYVVCRSSSIFPSRETLLEFESALRTQFRIDSMLEFNGTPTRERLEEIRDLAFKSYPRWKTLLEQEQHKEENIYESGEGAYLRRFSPAWVYTRILHKGLQPLGRFKEYKEEHRILTELLAQRLFHPSRRGAWYQRKALLEEHYMWSITPFDGRNEDAQRKFWRRIALRTCEQGLEDPACHVIYHYDLQKRIRKLEKALKVVKREQHDFGHVDLKKPEERTVEGIRVEREDPPAPPVRIGSSEDVISRPQRSGPTIWIDEREGGCECRVESMCLSWYRDQGWKGYHSEGGIVRTLFGYLFYDIMFTYIPNVFQTHFQTCPLDLHTDAFYPSRASEINHRLVEITNGAAERLIRTVHEQHSALQPCAIGIDWTFELDDLIEIVQCFRGEALAIICKIMAEEYQQRGGGIPDLFLWRVDRKEVMFVEVKSENDRLSDTQRLWIHVLGNAGVKVELCHAVAKEVRVV